MKQCANKLEQRRAALMPNGVPRWIRIYDDGDCCDRYTVVYTGAAAAKRCGEHPYRSMSAAPYHPQGFCQWGAERYQAVDTVDGDRRGRGRKWPPAIGRSNWLGKRIAFRDLPPDCRRVVISDYTELWQLKDKSETERKA